MIPPLNIISFQDLINNPRITWFREISIRITIESYWFYWFVDTYPLFYIKSPKFVQFLQKSCIVLYNSWFSLFAYLNTLSKIYEKCLFQDFSSIFEILLLKYFPDSHFKIFHPINIDFDTIIPLSCEILNNTSSTLIYKSSFNHTLSSPCSFDPPLHRS